MARKKNLRIRDYSAAKLQDLLQSSPSVLVHFGTDWCAPCRRLERVLAELLEQTQLSLPVAKINVEDEPDFARTLGVTKNPTLCLFEKGELQRMRLGYADPSEVLAFLAES